MFIRSMVNGAVHFAGGVVLGVLSVFAAKGAADMMGGASRRGPDGYGGHGDGGHGDGGHGDGGHGGGLGGAGEARRADPYAGAGPDATDLGSPPGRGFDKAAGA